MDWQHGFSLQPVNINTQILPGYEMVLTITPDTNGDQTIICNEYLRHRSSQHGRQDLRNGGRIMNKPGIQDLPGIGLQFHKPAERLMRPMPSWRSWSC